MRDGLVLTVGQSARVELALDLGTLSAEVQVRAESPLLNTESATLSQVITNEQIVDLPLNGRGFHELARLTSGVALLPPTGNVQTVRPEQVNGNVIGGVGGAQTRFLLDGVDITEEHQGGTWIQTSVDALQEFSVQQNAYSAEFHGAGATFNVTTKSGGNVFHGSLFEFVRNDAFDAKNFFATSKEKLERNQYGGTLGGPGLIPGLYDGRGKTFFFASYEGQGRQQGEANVTVVPTAAQRQGDFRGLAPIFDPLTTAGTARDQFADNVIPQNRLSPQASFFNQYIPLPNAAGNTYASTPMTSFKADQVTLRLDQEINSQHRLFARFSKHLSSEERESPWPTLGSTRLEGPAFNLAGSLTSNFGSSVVHEVRFSRMYGEYRSTAFFQGQGVQLMQQAGVTGLEGIQDPNIASIPAFTISGYRPFSGNTGDGRPKWQDRGEYEITDNLTWIKGKHILKVGGRMYRRNILFTDARSHNGVYNYTGVMTQRPSSPAGTGNAFADWMLGYPASATRSNPATWWGGTGTYWHVFMQDDVRVTNELTLNLGLRYEYTPWLTGYRNQAAAFDPTRARPIIVSSETDQIDLAAQPLADVGYALFGDLIQTSSQAGVPLTITKNDKGQIAPRLGFAWRLWRPHRHSRRLRRVLRSGGHERPAELQLPSVQPQRSRKRHGERRADANIGQLFSRRALWRVCWRRRLDPAASGGGHGVRPALEYRRSAGDPGSHQRGAELRRHQRLESATGRADQHPAIRAGEYSGAQAVSAIRHPQHQQSGAVERVSRAAGQAAEETGRRPLVSRVIYVFQEPHHGTGARNWRELHLRYGTGDLRYPAYSGVEFWF